LAGKLATGVGHGKADDRTQRGADPGPGELAVEPCSGVYREEIELFFSTPPELRPERGASAITVRPRF
jgi:hypothetical protein